MCPVVNAPVDSRQDQAGCVYRMWQRRCADVWSPVGPLSCCHRLITCPKPFCLGSRALTTFTPSRMSLDRSLTTRSHNQSRAFFMNPLLEIEDTKSNNYAIAGVSAVVTNFSFVFLLYVCFTCTIKDKPVPLLTPPISRGILEVLTCPGYHNNEPELEVHACQS